jgi:hypothetical protein
VPGARAGPSSSHDQIPSSITVTHDDCGVVPGFKGHESPLRHQATLASCRFGGHQIWWAIDAKSEEDALRLLPFYVAERTTITRVSEVEIP